VGERLYYFWLRFRWPIVMAAVLLTAGAGALAGTFRGATTAGPVTSVPAAPQDETQVVADGESALDTCVGLTTPQDLFECRVRLEAKSPIVVRADGGAFLAGGEWRDLVGDGEEIEVAGPGADALDAALADIASGFAADLDNDGSPEYVLSVGESGKRRLVILSAGPDGKLRDTTRIRGFGETCASVRGCIRDVDLVLPVDADEDGWLDIIVSSAYAGETDWADVDSGRDLSIVANRGWRSPGTFVEQALTRIGAKSAGVDPTTLVWRIVDGATVDMDRDGHSDLVLADRNGNGVVHWGSGSLEAWADSAPTRIQLPIGATGLAIGDVDGDGDDDLLVSYDVSLGNAGSSLCAPRSDGRPCTPYPGLSFSGGVAVILGDGRRSFTPDETLALADVAGASDVEFADFDGDGLPEIAVARENLDEAIGGVVVHRPRLENGTVSAYTAGQVIGKGPVGRIRAADVDGDGRVDLAMTGRGETAARIWRNPGDPIRYLRLTLAGSAGLDVVGTTPAALAVVVTVSDLDGDNRTVSVTSDTPPGGILLTLPLTAGGWRGDEAVPRVEVLFPATGRKVVLTSVPTGETVTVTEPAQ